MVMSPQVLSGAHERREAARRTIKLLNISWPHPLPILAPLKHGACLHLLWKPTRWLLSQQARYFDQHTIYEEIRYQEALGAYFFDQTHDYYFFAGWQKFTPSETVTS